MEFDACWDRPLGLADVTQISDQMTCHLGSSEVGHEPSAGTHHEGDMDTLRTREQAGRGAAARPGFGESLYIVDQFSARERVRIIRAQPAGQVGRHAPELPGGHDVVPALGHLPGDAELEGQGDRVVQAEPAFQVRQHHPEFILGRQRGRRAPLAPGRC